MRQQRSSSFGINLTKAIRRIAKSRPTTIPAIEREITIRMIKLGYPMKTYTVNGWRRGYVPSELQQITCLVRWGIEQGLDQQWAENLLKSVRFPQLAGVLQEIFGTASVADAAQAAPTILFLPPRPHYLLGRAKELSSLRRALEKPGMAAAITGLPGVGKSALAAELVYQILDASGSRLFPDGIIFLSAQDIHDSGLRSFLSSLLACFQVKFDSNQSLPEIQFQVLQALAGKRVLFWLDDIPPDFPLDKVLEILLTHSLALDRNTLELTCCTVLVTSRVVPQSPRLSFHLSLEPLHPHSALELLRRLAYYQNPRSITTAEAQQLCEAVGYLPLAIELIAQVIKLDSRLMPLLCKQPLIIDTQDELANRFFL